MPVSKHWYMYDARTRTGSNVSKPFFPKGFFTLPCRDWFSVHPPYGVWEGTSHPIYWKKLYVLDCPQLQHRPCSGLAMALRAFPSFACNEAFWLQRQIAWLFSSVRTTEILALQCPSSKKCLGWLLREDPKQLPAAMVRVPREGFVRGASQALNCCNVSWGSGTRVWKKKLSDPGKVFSSSAMEKYFSGPEKFNLVSPGKKKIRACTV